MHDGRNLFRFSKLDDSFRSIRFDDLSNLTKAAPFNHELCAGNEFKLESRITWAKGLIS